MNQRRVVGIVVVLLGGLFLLNSLNLGINAWDLLGTYWPVIIIIIGLFNLFGSDGVRLSGIIMVSVGVLFLLDSIGFELIGLDTWDLILPGLIILIGVWLLFPKSGNKVSSKHFIRQMAIFSGAEVQCDSEEFKGAELFALFGGVDLDLRAARVGEDGPAKIDVFAAFGGVDIIVPEGARVKVTGIPLFGGWSNKCQKSSQPGEADFHVNAFVMFGGMEIKDRK